MWFVCGGMSFSHPPSSSLSVTNSAQKPSHLCHEDEDEGTTNDVAYNNYVLYNDAATHLSTAMAMSVKTDALILKMATNWHILQ